LRNSGEAKTGLKGMIDQGHVGGRRVRGDVLLLWRGGSSWVGGHSWAVWKLMGVRVYEIKVQQMGMVMWVLEFGGSLSFLLATA
jgi:hypothetical protein